MREEEGVGGDSGGDGKEKESVETQTRVGF